MAYAGKESEDTLIMAYDECISTSITVCDGGVWD